MPQAPSNLAWGMYKIELGSAYCRACHGRSLVFSSPLQSPCQG
jgi:hypothetical protein